MARVLVLAMAAALAMILGVTPSRAQLPCITNSQNGTISVSSSPRSDPCSYTTTRGTTTA
jgi:hypothetical protein